MSGRSKEADGKSILSGEQQERLEVVWSIIEESVRRASVSIASIWVTNWGSHKNIVVGTGFVIVHKTKFYFVTARHVLDVAFQYKEIRTQLFGEVADLHGLYFISCPISDISVTSLPDYWLTAHHMRFLYAPSTSDLPSEYEDTEEYVMAGFPASANKVDVRWPPKVVGAKMLVMPARLNDSHEVRSNIPDPIEIYYDHKRREANTAPALQGVSGGPLFRVTKRNIKSRDMIGLGIKPVGVLCEWHKREKTVIAVKISAVIALIDNRQQVWSLAGRAHAGVSESIQVCTHLPPGWTSKN